MNKLNFSLAVISIVLFFILIAVVALGGYFCVSLGHLADTLNAPASTSNVSIDCDISVSQNGSDLILDYMRIYHIEGSVNSKILDLVLLAMNDK